MKQLTLSTPQAARTSTLTIGAGLFGQLGTLLELEGVSSVTVVTDTNVAPHHLDKLSLGSARVTEPIILPPGEETKTLATLEGIWQAMYDRGLDRKSLVLNLGGGVIGDMGGFAASTFMRGLRFVQLPTSLLAQVDASVGGKTGINFSGVKNILGAFSLPEAVFIDLDALQTLPPREFAAGFAEIIKHGLIQDAAHLEQCAALSPAILDEPAERSEALRDLIAASCAIKAQVVERDETESGLRKILNFGHTVGHAIEALSHTAADPLLHGEAVSLGIVVEAEISRLLGNISSQDVEEIEQLLALFHLPTRFALPWSETQLLQKMHADKKNVSGSLRWVLLQKVGQAIFDIQVPPSLISQALSRLDPSGQDGASGGDAFASGGQGRVAPGPPVDSILARRESRGGPNPVRSSERVGSQSPGGGESIQEDAAAGANPSNSGADATASVQEDAAAGANTPGSAAGATASMQKDASASANTPESGARREENLSASEADATASIQGDASVGVNSSDSGADATASGFLEASALRLVPPGGPIEGEFMLLGSKSYMNRALIIAALAEGETVLSSISPSDDSRALMAGLSTLGISFEKGEESLKIRGGMEALRPVEAEIDIGAAGTTMRFLTALCALTEGATITLCGSERMHQRPIGDLVEALRGLGAEIEYLGTWGCPPLRIRGKRRGMGRCIAMNGAISSQFFTALLLASPLFPDGLEIEVRGAQISRSYIDMTLHIMRAFGVEVENRDYTRYIVAPGQRYQGRAYRIEGDASGASYIWGLAALSQGRVRVHNISFESLQGDAQFPRLLEAMGCTARTGAGEDGTPWIEVTGAAVLRGIEADLESMPDTAQTLAVIASVAEGQTHLTGLATLKHKETDRLQALHDELQKLGISSTISDEAITVAGGDPKGPARIRTYEDHRVAMSFAILGARLPDLVIEDPRVVAKSFPTFWETLLGFGLRPVLAS